MGEGQGRREGCRCLRGGPVGAQRGPAVSTDREMVLKFRCAVGTQLGITRGGEQRLKVAAPLPGFTFSENRTETLPAFGDVSMR